MPESDWTAEDMSEHARDCAIRDKAVRWLVEGEKEIDALAGREATSAEKAIPRMVVLAELAASMYVDLRKEHGHVIAQETLKNAVTLIAGLLRRNGEDVRMIFRMDFEKVAAPPVDSDAAAAEPVPQVCECQVDQDGRCQECSNLIHKFVSSMTRSIEVMRDADLSQKPVCQPCFRRELDPGIARFVRNELSKLDPETAEAAMKAMFAASQGMQAMAMPLTTKAWGELLDKRGPKSP